MLSAIKDIGELVAQKELSIESKIDGKVLTILIDADKPSYSGIYIEDFDSEKINQYLYKPGASKGNVSSPFCFITKPKKDDKKKEGERTYEKIEGWLKQCIEIREDAFQDKIPFISKVSSVLKGNRENIIADIEQKTKDLPKKVSRFLTVKIDEKYLGEYEVFEKCLVQFEENKRKRSANLGVCSICGSTDKEVSGKTDVFRFYTIDKPGFISGGFREGNAWKNFPVCIDCKIALDNGRKFIDDKLNFKFYGLNYYLIPRLLIDNNKILGKILDILSDTTKTVGLKERIRKRITNDEDEILEYLSDEKDVLTLNFLFLQRQQSAERILLLIEDVFPSRIRKIFEAKNYVDKIFNNDSEKGFTFGMIRTFLSKSDENKKTSDLNKYFLEVVDSVFKDRRLDYSFLLKFYMVVIRKEFINDGYFGFRVKDALMNTVFFENLGLIIFGEVMDMEEGIFSSVFARFGTSFGTPAKQGVFLMGALTQLLLNKQWSERNAKPFTKKLKSLKMSEKHIKALLPEVQNKLEEYDSFDKGKRLIASEATKYLLEAGEQWKMPIDEINFYFACGMNLADSVAEVAYTKENNKKEE